MRLDSTRPSSHHLRIFGLVVIAVGIPSALKFWIDMGWIWGVVILGLHVYVGAFLAFALPRLRAHYAS